MDVQLTLNTHATNRTVSSTDLSSDALLLVDEPHSIANPNTPLLACGAAGTNDDGTGACSITGKVRVYIPTTGHLGIPMYFKADY
jgi:hypothetical protein